MTSPLKSKLVIINSKDKVSGDSNCYKINLSETSIHDVKQVTLISATFLNSENNINTKTNTLTYSVGGAPDITVSIPLGQYSISTILPALVVPTLTFSLLAEPVSRIEVVSTNGAIVVIRGTGLATLLGITEDLSIPIAGTVVATQIPDLVGLKVLHVSSKTLSHSNSISSSDATTHILSSIPITVNYGQLQSYSADHVASDKITYGSVNSLDAIDVEFLDHNLQPTELQSGTSLVLRVLY